MHKSHSAPAVILNKKNKFRIDRQHFFSLQYCCGQTVLRSIRAYSGTFPIKGGKTKCVKIGNGGNRVSGCVIEG